MQPHVFLAFCCGLFGVAGQTLLLAECLAVFAGGELWISSLMAMWFLAGAGGAFIARRGGRRALRLTEAAEVFSLAYIPVLGLQYLATVLPAGTGGESGPILPLHQILGWSLLIAGPGGLLTGWLLSILCRPSGKPANAPAIGVCVWSAAGGIVGGAGAAFLLHAGMGIIGIFLRAMIFLCLVAAGSAWVRPARKRRWTECGVLTSCLALALTGAILHADVPLTRVVQARRWKRLVPGGTLEGSFRTREAEYLYGRDADRWVVVRGGGVHEVIGDRIESGRIAAVALAQNFKAQRILVIGRGLAVCERFLMAPDVEVVDWYDPDLEYAQALQARLPQAFGISDSRFHCVADEVRTMLVDRPGNYDVVVVNLPRMVDGRLHRLMAVEFFDCIRRSLRPLGVVVVGIVGDRNVPGEGPAHQGAWVESTLETVFTQTVLTRDGSRTVFISAAEACLQVFPVLLQARFGLIENAGEIFPVESLERLYRPDLSAKMLESYDAVDVPRERLVNRDDNPSYRLSGLLQAASQSGLSLNKPVRALFRGGLLVLIVPVVLLAGVRLAYVVRTVPRTRAGHDPPHGPALESDVLFLGVCAAAVGYAGLTVLMHVWLSHAGWQPAHIGLVFSLFALGLAGGATGARWAVCLLHAKGPLHLRSVLWAYAAILAIQGAALAIAGLVVAPSTTWQVAALLLVTYGFPGGAAVVLAAKILEGCADDADSSSAHLAGNSCFGAAGGCLAGLCLVPLTGLEASLSVATVAAFVLAVLAVGAQYESVRPGRRMVPHPVLTPLGYGLLGVALSLIAGSHILAYAERSDAAAQATVAVLDWVQGRRLSAKTVVPTGSGPRAAYHEVREGAQLKGYIFRSEDFCATVYGYGGPMAVVLFADPGGTLVDFRITRSYETPRYISRIRSWMESLKGHKVFGPDPLQGVNAVSGATLSCNAILRLLRNSGSQFDTSVRAGGQGAGPAQEGWFKKVDWLTAYWAAGVVLALIVIRHGRLWSRMAMLGFAAAVGGLWLNRQYSTDHVMRLLSGQGLLGSPMANTCLLLGTPVLILLLGNIYCGYLCPFGAVQELLGFVLPQRLKARPKLSTITAARFIKYGVLFSLILVFFGKGSRWLSELDPLTLVFNRQFWSEGLLAAPGLILAVLMLLLAPFITRVWCRYLCPTGAFLSLFNLAGWLGRFLPGKKFGRCEFGLSGRDHLDCIRCDRCRYDSPLIPSREEAISPTADAPRVSCEST